MADTWGDDSDDEWDVADDDDELDKRLGLKKPEAAAAAAFDDEEDLAVKEKAEQERLNQVELKKKGTALQAKKRAEKERLEEEELARRVMELEAEAEENMSPEEYKEFKRRQVEEADHALTNDLFGNVDSKVGPGTASAASGGGAAAGDQVVMKDLKDHLKHARKVSEAIKSHGKIHSCAAFIKEVLQETKDILDDAAISDIIKICNVIKNEKVQAAKRKVKGQASKSKKADKVAEMKARQLQVETFGDNDNYDDIDAVGAAFEDSFF